MVDRTNAERQHCYIARLKALAAAEARIQEIRRGVLNRALCRWR